MSALAFVETEQQLVEPRLARRVALYARISKDDAGNMIGVGEQIRQTREYARRYEYEIVVELVDDDISAYGGLRRPGYEKLLDLVRAGQIDVIVAWSADRIERQHESALDFGYLMREIGASVELVKGGHFDFRTAQGFSNWVTAANQSWFESSKKSEATLLAHQRLAREGKPSGGIAPFPYRDDAQIVGSKIVRKRTADEWEAGLVRDAAQRLLQGSSPSSICDDWNDKGARTREGKLWHATALRRVMTSPRIAGLRVHGIREVPDPRTPKIKRLVRTETFETKQWPAIISVEQHEQLVALYSRHRRRAPRSQALLSNVLICGHCGETLTAHVNKQGRRVYTCQRLIPPGDRGGKRKMRGCSKVAIVGQPLEELLRSWTIETFDQPGFAQAYARRRRGDDGQRIDQIRAELAEIERQREEDAADRAARRITRAQLLTMNEQYDLDEQRLGRELSQLVVDEHDDSMVEDFAGTLGERWDELDTGQRRTLIERAFPELVVLPVGKGGRVPPEKRLQVRRFSDE